MTVGITELPPEGMQLGGVALAGDTDRGTRTTEGLSLLFTTAGITVQGPQPQIERLLVWSGLDSAVCREKIDLPDGRNAVVLELRSGGQSIRFLLPMDAVTPGQAAYLDQALPAWLARYKGPRGPVEPATPAPPPPAREAAAASAPTGNGTGSEAPLLGSTAASSSATSTSGPASQPPPPLSFRFPTPSPTASGEGVAPGASKPTADRPTDPALLGAAGAALPPRQPGTSGPTVGTQESNGLAESPVDEPGSGRSSTTEREQPGRDRGAKDGTAVAAVATAGALAGAAKLGGASAGTSTVEPTPTDVPPKGPVAPFGSPAFGLSAQERVAAQTRKNNRIVLVVLLVILLIAVGGIAYFATRKNSTSTATTVVVNPSPSRATADAVLAGSINLRRTDLPAGWKPVSVAARAPLPTPTPPVAAQIGALRSMSSCVGQPFVLLAGLLGDGTVPGTSAAVTSPTFESAIDPGIRMVSTTTVTSTIVDNRVLAAPFANPNFATCFGTYQSQLASAAVPGATASVQTVSLPVPTGVTTFAFLTTFNLPGHGSQILSSQVLGEAFIFAGRNEVRLVPSTNGPPVPQSAFAQAYDSITSRLAAALRR